MHAGIASEVWLLERLLAYNEAKMATNVSSERAGQILREWQEQRTTLFCTLVVGDFAAACLESARITELGSNVFLSDIGNQSRNRIMFDLTAATFAPANIGDVPFEKIIGSTRTAKKPIICDRALGWTAVPCGINTCPRLAPNRKLGGASRITVFVGVHQSLRITPARLFEEKAQWLKNDLTLLLLVFQLLLCFLPPRKEIENELRSGQRTF